MNPVYVYSVASAALCLALAIFAGPVFRWGQRLTRRLGYHKMADFRERLWPFLGPIARIVLVVTAALILALTWRMASSAGRGSPDRSVEDIGAAPARSQR